MGKVHYTFGSNIYSFFGTGCCVTVVHIRLFHSVSVFIRLNQAYFTLGTPFLSGSKNFGPDKVDHIVFEDLILD